MLSAQHIPFPHMASHRRIQPSLIACLFTTTHPNLHISVCVCTFLVTYPACLHTLSSRASQFVHTLFQLCPPFHHVRLSLFTHSFSSVHPFITCVSVCSHTLSALSTLSSRASQFVHTLFQLCPPFHHVRLSLFTHSFSSVHPFITCVSVCSHTLSALSTPTACIL